MLLNKDFTTLRINACGRSRAETQLYGSRRVFASLRSIYSLLDLLESGNSVVKEISELERVVPEESGDFVSLCMADLVLVLLRHGIITLVGNAFHAIE